MSSVHSWNAEISVKAGTTTVATSTAEYLATYWSATNTVALMNTTTNYSKFAGVVQAGGYASASGGSVRISPFGYSKVKFSGANTATAIGDYVSFDTDTTTSWGTLRVQARTVSDLTSGSAYILGQIQGISAGTGTVSQVFINPSFSQAITTTVTS
jgi:hypothetical protein